MSDCAHVPGVRFRRLSPAASPPRRGRGLAGTVATLAVLVVLVLVAWHYGAMALAAARFPDGTDTHACDGHVAPEGDIGRLYGWNFKGKPWCFSASFSQATLDHYRASTHLERRGAEGYQPFVDDPADDAPITHVVQQFRDAAKQEGWDDDRP